MKTITVKGLSLQTQPEQVERAKLPPEATHIVVCIQSLEDGAPVGELLNAYLPEPVPFTGLSDMILKMDGIYDYFDFPQIDRENRTFAKRPRCSYDRLAPYIPQYFQKYSQKFPKHSKLVLAVYTRFWQHGSWQGSVCCLQLNKAVRYVSALQFLKLAEEAVETVMA